MYSNVNVQLGSCRRIAHHPQLLVSADPTGAGLTYGAILSLFFFLLIRIILVTSLYINQIIEVLVFVNSFIVRCTVRRVIGKYCVVYDQDMSCNCLHTSYPI